MHRLWFILLGISITGLFCGTLPLHAQYGPATSGGVTYPWPEGKGCAVSLSFDDARGSQVNNGVPLFNKYGIKATFYCNPGNMERNLKQWVQAAETGHELGNHTVTHPCSENFPNHNKMPLSEHTLESIEQEMLDCTAAIKELTGYTTRVFAYPCGQQYVGWGTELRSYIPVVGRHFLSGRGWQDEYSNNPARCDLAHILGMKIDQLKFKEMKDLVDKARKEGAWLVFAGHEIGPAAPGLTTIDTELEKLCQYMTDPANGIWTATVGEVSEYIIEQRKKE